jgi:NhaP-type Na+/H+ or K+/H+ antiporter
MAPALLGISLLFFLGHGLRWFFIKTKIPDLLILVLIGYFCGPVFGLIDPSDLGKVGAVLSTVALVVILYEGGLELHGRDLLKSSLPALIMAAAGFFSVVALASGAAFALALQEWTTSILFGLALGCVSAAIVIPMVKQLTISKDTKTMLTLESAFTDVITIVIFLVIVDAISSNTFNVNKLIHGIGPKTLLSIMAGATSAFIWAWARKRFVFLSEILFAGEAWAVLTYGIIEIPHYNGVIGVFALGFTLANLNLLPGWAKKQLDMQPVTKDDLSLLSELTFLLKTFFFIYLGLLVNFSDWKIVIFATFVAALIPITRYLALRFFYKAEQFTKIDAMMITAMGPRGLATAVLATIPMQKGLVGGEWIQNTLFAVIPISIVMTAIMVFLSENRDFRNNSKKLFGRYKEALPQTNQSSDSNSH